MKTLLATGIPLALCWLGAGCALVRAFPGLRLVPVLAAGGFLGGAGCALALASTSAGDAPFAAARTVIALLFMALCASAVLLLYRNRGVSFALPAGRLPVEAIHGGVAALVAGGAMGLAAMLALPYRELPAALVPLAAGGLIPFAALALEPRLLKRFAVTGHSLNLLLTALLLFMGSLSPRLDLFAPLSMKLMKFIHDFVHQFFESMLIPDHLFFTSRAWDWIGFLFGNDVGFWGGLVIWFAPALLITLGMAREPLPSVAAIRQGARRRQLLAGYLRERRRRLAVPILATAIFALAVYRSLNPAVDYWDPKPIPVTAGTGGKIMVPLKGEGYDLDDGKLHKFLHVQGGKEYRFFVIRKPDGKLAVTLDACAICQPEGYGQGDGTVICYYCKTLIPLETVGEPGGCNPVPVRFVEAADGVRIAAGDIVSVWESTVQGEKAVPGRGK